MEKQYPPNLLNKPGVENAYAKYKLAFTVCEEAEKEFFAVIETVQKKCGHEGHWHEERASSNMNYKGRDFKKGDLLSKTCLECGFTKNILTNPPIRFVPAVGVAWRIMDEPVEIPNRANIITNAQIADMKIHIHEHKIPVSRDFLFCRG